MTPLSPGRDAFLRAPFRNRFLLALLVIDAAAAGVILAVLYFMLSRPLAGDYGAVFHALRHQTAYFLPSVAYAGLVYVVLAGMAVAVLCVFRLHRIAGPLYRMERVLENFLAGEAVRPAFFRRGDQLRALAASFNAFVARIREDRQRWLGRMEHAERLCFQDRETCRAEMDKALAELEVLLSRYR